MDDRSAVGAGAVGAGAIGVRVKVHPGLCEGWGNCHRWAPACYPLDDDGCIDVHLLEVPPEHALDAWLGAQACPQGAITVIGGPGDRYWLDLLHARSEQASAR